ncbi:chymase-like [Misgurnus anguillicaudatus]|uniref:chymase-like n=1 Tax=Misgurnus anguillicaudatus TaxID=75329 RepID=UPI003CCF724E
MHDYCTGVTIKALALQHLVSSRALCLSGYISGSSATVCSSVSISRHPGLLHDGSFHSSMASHAHVSPCSRPRPGLHLSSSSLQCICLQNLFLLFIALHGASVGVVNSQVSIPHSHPYMVFIRHAQTHIPCSGFLMREDFVMTAAHCKREHLRVYLGVNDTNYLPAGIEVDAFPHPDFDSKNMNDDIMLLKLKTPVTLSETVNIIALPETNREEISSNCMVMGWGWQEYNVKTPSSVLREVNLTRLPSKNCATPHTLCTAGPAGPAGGDSGSPLICGNVPQGIASYCLRNEFTSYLTMYTKISHYLPWIHEMLNAHKLWKSKLDAFKISDIRVCMIEKITSP